MISKRMARRFCCEDVSKIENYRKAVADETQVWHIHHRRETDEGLSLRELQKRGEYFSRPAAELIFLRHDAHRHLHNLNLSDETRNKMSDALSGEKNPMFGKTHTEETRKKISQAMSGNKHSLGYHWWNNGIKSVCARECPPGFVRGRLPWKKMEKTEDERAERL